MCYSVIRVCSHYEIKKNLNSQIFNNDKKDRPLIILTGYGINRIIHYSECEMI